ncbi:unnamed protein product [Zymoseptoria tritici ST99CH_1A5]|uniref:Uncharacterized protein n=1 Tax=Zymoseptoria tritici ST99CH_1A5 TaxID=1276529 RepID=A0A1Y6LZ41_ZYMTR|nr:unnamed protein product [Zymoseptoria tritici ST99CH_1A5]
MAQVQLPRHQQQQQRVRIAASHSPGKENIPPTWANGAPHSTAKKHHDKSRSKHRKDRTAREVLAPLPAGVLKSTVAKDGFFQQFGKHIHRQNSEDDPLRVRPGFFAKYRQDEVQEQGLEMGFSEAAHEYCDSAATHLELRHTDLTQIITTRKTGFDADGNPVPRSGVPTQADFDALFQEMKVLDRDIEEEQVSVKFTRPDGTENTTLLHFGRTLELLCKRKEEKQARIAELQAERDEVKEEMDGLVKEIEGESEEGKKAEEGFEKEMEGFRKEEEECKKKAKRKMREMKKEEDQVTEEFNRKVEELFVMASAQRG